MTEKEMRARLADLDERLAKCRSELLALAEGDLGEDEAKRFEELETEHDALKAEREPLAERVARLDEIRATYRRAQQDGRGIARGAGPVFVPGERRDPFADLDQVRGGMLSAGDLRARAVSAVEIAPHMDDDARQHTTRLLEHGDRHGRIARHILLTGSDAYTRAFEQLLEGRQPWQLDGEELEALRTAETLRAAMAEGSGSTGGYLVPFHLDPTIILSNAGSTNPFRRIARTETISTNTWHGVSSAGVTAEWLDEATEVGDHSPSFAQPTVPTHRASSWLQASFEVTQDTSIASQVGRLLADARDNLEATAFAVGTGTGQPKGVVTAVGAASGSVVASKTADTYTIDDVYALAAAMPPRWTDNAVWVMNKKIALATRQFATGSGPQHAFWADLGVATPPLLLGQPVHESSAMDGTVDAGTDNDILLLGDFSQYLIVDRIGMTVQYEPLVKGANQRPTGEVGWFAHWRVGADVLVPDAFRLLRA